MANTKPEDEKLLDQEKLFVEAYVVNFNATQAAKEAGYATATAGKRGHALLQRPRVAKAIEQRLQTRARSSWLREEEVLEGLYREANYFDQGTSHSARIAAWVKLGEHIGMFREKKTEEEKSVTFQIINYHGENEKLEHIKQEAAKALEEISSETAQEAVGAVIEGVSIRSYTKEPEKLLDSE